MQTRTCIDFDWRFVLGDVPAARERNFDDSAWRLLDLPHDWSIESTPDRGNPAGAAGGFYPGGVGWYRRRVDIPKDLAGRRVLVEFDGAYMNSEVWCNGAFVGQRPYGYSSFCYDLTTYIDPEGGNPLAVRIDNSRQRNSRWYTGSGIYRHVYLTIAAPVRIGHWGTYVKMPEVSRDRATVRVATTIVNDTPTDAQVTLNSTVVDDAKGVLVPDAAREVAFDLRGEGRLIGVDNGDPLDLGDVKASRRRTFNGMCLAIVQAARSPGAMEIAATADGLTPASAVVTVE